MIVLNRDRLRIIESPDGPLMHEKPKDFFICYKEILKLSGAVGGELLFY